MPAVSVTAGVVLVKPLQPDLSSLQARRLCRGLHVVDTRMIVSKLA